MTIKEINRIVRADTQTSNDCGSPEIGSHALDVIVGDDFISACVREYTQVGEAAEMARSVLVKIESNKAVEICMGIINSSGIEDHDIVRAADLIQWIPCRKTFGYLDEMFAHSHSEVRVCAIQAITRQFSAGQIGQDEFCEWIEKGKADEAEGVRRKAAEELANAKYMFE